MIYSIYVEKVKKSRKLKKVSEVRNLSKLCLPEDIKSVKQIFKTCSPPKISSAHETGPFSFQEDVEKTIDEQFEALHKGTLIK
jgi:hypothetical protein